MKKELMILMAVLLLTAACVQQQKTDEEIDLIKELQDIERELSNGSNDTLNELDELEDSLVTGASTADIDAQDAESTVEDVVEDLRESLENNEELDTSTLQRIEVEETEIVDLKIDATDEDADPLTFLFSPPLDEAGTWTTTYGDEGEYVVTIAASDGTNTVEQNVLLVVKKKNVAPEVSNVPEVLAVDEGADVSISPDIVDKNSDEVTVVFSEPLDENGEWTTDHTSAGEYVITVTVSDGETQTEKTTKLTVRNVNVPPEITGLEDSITVKEGETVTIQPSTSDLDNDKVELTLSEPVGTDGVWETTYTDNGEYVVTVTATDGKDTVKKELKVTVTDVNVPPQIIGIKKG